MTGFEAEDVAEIYKERDRREAASAGAAFNQGVAPIVGTGDLLGCGVCGGKMVFVRGRYPGTDNRKVCPTCLADRMDMIQELTSAEYGQAHEAHTNVGDELHGGKKTL